MEPCPVEVARIPASGLMTCYDLRFPELARTLVEQGAEALVVPAAWVAGDRKVEHWRTLLRARAIENTVWVVGVGQPGSPLHRPHDGGRPRRRRRGRGRHEDDAVLDAVLDRQAVADVRRTNPSLVQPPL